MKDYRRFYAKFFDITIPPEFDIHHIDFNRENNDIKNLILLPKELHEHLHSACKPEMIFEIPKEDLLMFRRIANHLWCSVFGSYFEDMASVYNEMQYWASCKEMEMYKKEGMQGPMFYSYDRFRK